VVSLRSLILGVGRVFDVIIDTILISFQVVNVRWAHEDPNPRAIREKKEDVLDKALTAIHASNPEVRLLRWWIG